MHDFFAEYIDPLPIAFVRLFFCILAFTSLWAKSADDKLINLFLFFLETIFKISGKLSDNLHGMSKPVF